MYDKGDGWLPDALTTVPSDILDAHGTDHLFFDWRADAGRRVVEVRCRQCDWTRETPIEQEDE